MRTHRFVLPFALMSAAFFLGCQEQGSGPAGPEGLVPAGAESLGRMDIVGDPVSGVSTPLSGAGIGAPAAVHPAGSVTQTVGAGTAVTTVDASADFESTASLFGNPYVEDGISFSRTGLSFNNNGCGFAGCSSHTGFYPEFVGNYLYGVSFSGGFFTIEATGGEYFAGLEFLSGVGCNPSSLSSVGWEAYRDGSLVDAGVVFSITGVPVLGFSDPGGFDKLLYTRSCFTTSVSFSSGTNAPALDQVRVQFAVSNAPPDADAGDDQTVECTTAGAGATTLDGSGSSDSDGDALTYSWSEGGNEIATGVSPTVNLSLGTHTITLTVDDGNGGIDTDVVVIEVVDTTPPALTVTTSPESLWPANRKYVTIDLSALVSDACDLNPGVEVWIESSEPDNAIGNGDGNTTGDIRVTLSDGTVLLSSDSEASVRFDLSELDQLELRSERAGKGAGRSYTITVVATDASGNESATIVAVTVPHDQS